MKLSESYEINKRLKNKNLDQIFLQSSPGFSRDAHSPL